MQRDRPNVTVVYQDASQQAQMTCLEAIVSVLVLVAMVVTLGWLE